MFAFPEILDVVDSHTEGEPTRVVIDGWPEVAGATMVQRREVIEGEHEALRRAVVCEPRGHDAVVGALLTAPVEEGSVTGVVFFNNVGCLGMCGHGLIGVIKTLEWQGRLTPGEVRVDTPVGTVGARLEADGAVTLRNVAARVYRLDVALEVPELGRVEGDIAWGGNWFFLTSLTDLPLELGNLDRLISATRAIRRVLDREDLLGGAGVIDHVELFGPPRGAAADSTNFVLCPGGEYDRSPCGTGTSAKLAVLHARGRLPIGKEWKQESLTGGRFIGWLTEVDGELIPHIRGRAWITAQTRLVFDPGDPLRGGFTSVSA